MGAKWSKRQSPDDPPDIGPFAATAWDADRGEWDVWLTARGKAFLARWVAQYGSGVGLLRYKWPALYQKALDCRMEIEDIEAICRHAAARTLQTWHPERTLFPTYMAFFLRAYVQQAIRREDVAFQAGVSVGQMSFETAEGDVGLACDVRVSARVRALLEAEQDEMHARDRSARVRQMIRQAVPDPKHRQILALRFGLHGGDGLTLEAIGRRFGLSKERVRQIEARLLVRLRNHPGLVELVARPV